MFELLDSQPDCSVQEGDYIRLLGFPRHRTLEDRSRELANAARNWFAQHGKPWFYARQVSSVAVTQSQLRINGATLQSRLLHEQFTTAHARQAIVVAVSAGKECDEHARELWNDCKPDEYYFLEAFASAVVEHLIALAHGHICSWADNQRMAALPHHSPGNSGWAISDQVNLWSVLCNGMRGDPPGELSVLESGMLSPKKSLLALVGIASSRKSAEHFARFVPCETCVLPRCQFRRAPYKPSLCQPLR